MVSSDETEATTTVHTEAGLSDGRDAYEPFRVASRNPQVPAYREWWRRNPLNSLRAAGKANLWRRFNAEVVEGKTPLEAAQGDYTRTLDDLKQVVLPSDLADSDAPEPPSDELWWGTPDPSIYAEGAAHLSRKQIDEECEKGNIITLRRFREQLKDAKDWEIEVLQQLMELHRLKHQVLMPCGDGTAISFWDLYKYVRCNPELKALADRGVNAVEAAEGMTREERIRLLEDVAPWTLDPEAETMRLPERVALGLPCGLLAEAPYYSRRPTRWLKGLDGRKDFAYGLYVHEQRAADTLGPKWASKGAAQALSTPEYVEDLLAAGPLVGMTLVAVTSRPLPADEAVSAWGQRLSQHMERLASSKEAGPSGSSGGGGSSSGSSSSSSGSSGGAPKACCGGGSGGSLIPRPSFGPLEASQEALQSLASLLGRERLAEGTKLLDPEARCLREGATLLLTAAPRGGLIVQAISPGKVREQEHYLLGVVADERLSAALFDMFLHPQRALDTGFAARAGYQSLWYVNGFKSYNADRNPNVTGPDDAPRRAPRLPRRGRGAAWRLPAPGTDPAAAAPELLSSVKRRVMYHQVHEAFASAWEAADAVPEEEGADPRALANARRAAAEAALKRSLGGLGLNVQGLTLRPRDVGADLAALATPLQVP